MTTPNPRPPTWWNRQTTARKALIIGGATVVLLGVGAAAGGSPTSTASGSVATTAAAVTTSEPTTTASAQTTAPVPATPVTYTVTNVVDGDTVDLSTGERVRIIGIDAPEAGRCGADEATAHLSALVTGQAVTVTPGARDDVDRYGRILRYIAVNGVDAGLDQIDVGLAIARYDSRDGYGGHPREAAYVAADEAVPNVECAPVAEPAAAPAFSPVEASPSAPAAAPERQDPAYANCDAVRAAGAAPIHPGDPGWQQKFDRDRDGVGCE
jgi:endonuclease YncB( thermonuclease family)